MPTIARLARIPGPSRTLRKLVQVKILQGVCSDAQTLPSLLYPLITAGGNLNAVNTLGAGERGALPRGVPAARLVDAWRGEVRRLKEWLGGEDW